MLRQATWNRYNAADSVFSTSPAGFEAKLVARQHEDACKELSDLEEAYELAILREQPTNVREVLGVLSIAGIMAGRAEEGTLKDGEGASLRIAVENLVSFFLPDVPAEELTQDEVDHLRLHDAAARRRSLLPRTQGDER